MLARERLDRRCLHSLTVLGRVVGPEEAAAVGFLDEVVEIAELEGASEAAAEELAALGEAAYRGSLAAVRRTAIRRIEASVDAQRKRRDAVR